MIALLSARLRLLRAGRDRGVALITVIGLGSVLLLLSVTMVAVAASGSVKSRTDEDSAAAMSAAYAGIEDYQSKLAANNAYPLFGAGQTEFSKASSFPRGTDGNPAFGYGASGPNATWATIDNGARASFRYEVDNSKYYDNGVLRVRSTGRVGQITRSVVADLKQDGFIDYLYFTDYELSDPEFGLTTSKQNCVPTYDWDVKHADNCDELQFGSSDVLDGPVRTNDTLLICNSTFKRSVETAYRPSSSTARKYKIVSGCGTPTFSVPVASTDKFPMPATNLEMLQETRNDLKDSTVPRPGCLYTGPTTITLTADGKMTVRSPWTLATNIKGTPVSGGDTLAACGQPGTAKGQLGSADGATVDVPANNLVYVQSVTRSADASKTPDPNDWTTGRFPSYDNKNGATKYCTGGAGGSSTGNGVGYPRQGETAPSTSSTNPSYGCEKGDVFVEGTLKGNLTIAADNYVYVTDDITYTNSEQDILGLVGQQAVLVYNPVKNCTVNSSTGVGNGTYLYPGSNADRTIQAAILSVGHTFTVQNFRCGARGDLIIKGSIAQKFRGAVGQANGSGFSKKYGYDNRLRYTAPPKFLSPVSTSYGVSRLTESKTAFTSKGVEIK